MAGYAVSNLLGGTQQAISTSYKTLVDISASNGTALRRIKIVEFVFGTDGTPADQAMTYDVSVISALGTATSLTPNPLDPADSAFLGVAKGNDTVEPTVTANSSKWAGAVNQRATLRWVAFPGMELVIPATNAAGLAFRAKSPGYTGTAVAQVEFQEQ